MDTNEEKVMGDLAKIAETQESRYLQQEIEPTELEENEAEAEEKDIRQHPLFEKGYYLDILRMANGEWILGQFRLAKEYDIQAGVSVPQYYEFFKVFRFVLGKNREGKMAVSLSPWPTAKGRIELHEVGACGYTDSVWDGIDIEEVYTQAISPIARATAEARSVAFNQKRRQNVDRILDGLQRTK